MNRNQVELAGNLDRDPELRYTARGTAVVELGVVVSDRSKNKKGEWEDTWFVLDVLAWGRTAELAQQTLSKGDNIFIDGRLKLDRWEDKAIGEIHQKLRIVADRIDFMEPNPQASHENGERVDE